MTTVGNSDNAFDVVILTFPDQRAATAASQGPLWRQLQAQYTGVEFLATTDPFACRVGSGGGTLAALAEQQRQVVTSTSSNVLILHAGGQSSRCPTQMCFGKAWTTFPTTTGRLVTPVHIWLRFMFYQFTEIYGRLPAGSVAVIAADTMLRIPPASAATATTCLSSSPPWDTSSVLVLTVPAPLETAKNHGVFVLHRNDNDNNNIRSQQRGRAVPCRQVLQKPSMETLQQIFVNKSEAWIDTGVLIFLPTAAAVLRHLAVNEPHLYGCTRTGLEKLYEQQLSSSVSHDNDNNDINSFATKHALSIDLYTHVLQGLSLAVEENDDSTIVFSSSWEFYKQKFSKLPVAVARTLWKSLSNLKLQLLVEPAGQFLHLGTTAELMDFYTSSTATNHHDGDDTTPTILQTFAQDLGLTHRQHVVLVSDDNHDTLPSCASNAVLYHSTLHSQTELSIGSGTLVEFCQIDCSLLVVGKDCWISGLRSGCAREDYVVIPNGMVVQELVLNPQTRVYIVLGVHDAVKEATVLYGKPWSGVAHGRWKSVDIWDDDTTHTLWNAKLHPVLGADEDFCFTKLFAWLLHLDDGDHRHETVRSSDSRHSLEQWRLRKRLSLADIRELADASLESVYRENLLKHEIPQTRKQLCTQVVKHLSAEFDHYTRINLHPWQYTLKHAWNSVSKTMLVWLTNHMYDALGVSAMRFATFLLSVLETEPWSESHQLELSDVIDEAGRLQHFPEEGMDDRMTGILNKVNKILSGETFTVGDGQALEKIFLAISSACTRLCVGTFPLYGGVSTKPSAVLDRWVIVSSPARIDLAGGWSDTPPICFDGSVVAGMAVLVDGYAPLACRCRLTCGGSGILLRSESRSIDDGKLNSSLDVELSAYSDLRGFNDPTAGCALLKCALVCLGFSNSKQIFDLDSDSDFSESVQSFFGTENPCRVEIISTSLLPQGSGMGTSSILAGCVLASIAECRGTPLSIDRLIHLVLELEQMLTTGGGFQDQANGLVGGIKRIHCRSGVVQPIHIEWNVLPMVPHFEERLNRCLHLVYTGQTRLAKNILLQCLDRWSERTDEICQTVSNLLATAERATKAVEEGNMDAIGDALSDYWAQKKVMAGPSSGVEPPRVASLLSSLYKRDLIRGGSLCGAGGGGFLVLLSRDEVSIETMVMALRSDGIDASHFQWHKVCIDHDGLTTLHVEGDIFDISFIQRK